MLKKSLSVILGFVLIIMLAACGQTTEPAGKTDKNSTGESTKKETLTAEQLFERSTEASQNIKSFTANMDMKQNMSGVPEVGEMAIDSKIEMQFVTNPIQMYQKMTMNMGEELGGNMDTEMYLTTDGMFMYDPTTAGWMKFPTEMSDQLMDLTNQQGNPANELKKLQSFVDDLTFEEDDKNYILKLTASGEKLNQFIQETMAAVSPELTEGVDLAESMKVNNANYEVYLDKETYLPSQLNLEMDFDMTIENETMHISQTMSGIYTGYNEVDSITVPQEVLDTAVEMEM